MNILKNRNLRLVNVFFLLNICIFKVTNSNGQPSPIWQKFTFAENKMGSKFELIFFDQDSTHAKMMAKAANLIIDSLNHSFSDYDSTSEISKIAILAGKWVPVSADLIQILKESRAAYQATDGAFDITMGTLTKLWRKNRKLKTLPDHKEISVALKNKGIKYLKIDSKNNRAYLSKNGILLDLGGIGKGYAAERIKDFFYKNDMKRILINAAGNIAIGEAPIGKKQWDIAVEIPGNSYKMSHYTMELKDMAVSTSGDAYQFLELNGKKYSHIINPKTGLGLTNQKQVTIVCKNATKADWLSTACCILSTKKALILAEKEKASILIIENKGGKLIKNYSKSFSKLLKKTYLH